MEHRQRDPALEAGERGVSDTTRTVLIALGVALLAVILLPLLWMSGMMGAMMGGGWWLMTILLALVLLTGVVILATGLQRR